MTKSLLPVFWKTQKIDAVMDGKDLELKFFGYIETWELFSEYQDFVANRLG